MYLALFLVAIIIMAIASSRSIKGSCIALGKTNIIQSEILGEKRKIWVYVPACAKDPANADKKYPVVYLLDGNTHFSWLNQMVQQLSGEKENHICPDMIVVAIPNTNRSRDLTPTNYMFGPQGEKIDDFEQTGGGEKFADFIENELVPFINATYPTSDYKTLFGHSLGGLATMNILINRPEMFDAYIAIDPSMWWDDNKLLGQARTVFKQKNFAGKSLYLGIANTMPAGMDMQQVKADTSKETAHMRSVLELEDILKDNPGNGLKCSYKFYGECDHGSVSFKAGYDALKFLFSYEKQPQVMIGKP